MMERGTVRKNVEFYSKNKFDKLVHLVGFIVIIYHDARSPERKKCVKKALYHSLYCEIKYCCSKNGCEW